MNRKEFLRMNIANRCISTAARLRAEKLLKELTLEEKVRQLGCTTLLSADKVIFPGVGEARTTMDYLKACHMDLLIKELKQPVLGICLGMQLLCRHSEEGDADCLGIFDAEVKRFQSTNPEEKVPHMGWNTLSHLRSPLFQGMKEEEFVYFVHSFYVPVNEFTAATTD